MFNLDVQPPSLELIRTREPAKAQVLIESPMHAFFGLRLPNRKESELLDVYQLQDHL
jgi:hypothetical protein